MSGERARPELPIETLALSALLGEIEACLDLIQTSEEPDAKQAH
ncbi:hypothetical protein [Bradyrhizobium sacchari]|uniref:Uncharacterized protein n=1 Tax=Bradyrhizobium sacchari TaxID=1399419 RepID=A0A560HNK9_9BRAD|nr:hypothetical protein [Bradyrhizobium sacchari]TWB48127.1 hypothetical protein FBZ94_11656 [Bradyrhizobium sacchari]TWB67551.1 hypothetical protein FBZ95_11556 [Bradyrhizobium sacchari]